VLPSLRRPTAEWHCTSVPERLTGAWRVLWDVDALLFVVIFWAMLLLLPIPKTTTPVTGR
jgi:hypothetical protein